MTRWDAARVASRRQLPKPRKMHGPVGEKLSEETLQLHRVPDWDLACPGCGVHVCSCKHESDETRERPGSVDADFIPKDMPARPENKFNFPVSARCETGQTGSVDVAGLEKLRAEWDEKTRERIERFNDYHLRKAAEREQTTAFDDHFRHATEHALLAERMGRCALCYSTEHKLDDCLTMKAHLEALGMCR